MKIKEKEKRKKKKKKREIIYLEHESLHNQKGNTNPINTHCC
jgi:hypothetical protein